MKTIFDYPMIWFYLIIASIVITSPYVQDNVNMSFDIWLFISVFTKIVCINAWAYFTMLEHEFKMDMYDTADKIMEMFERGSKIKQG